MEDISEKLVSAIQARASELTNLHKQMFLVDDVWHYLYLLGEESEITVGELHLRIVDPKLPTLKILLSLRGKEYLHSPTVSAKMQGLSEIHFIQHGKCCPYGDIETIYGKISNRDSNEFASSEKGFSEKHEEFKSRMYDKGWVQGMNSGILIKGDYEILFHNPGYHDYFLVLTNCKKDGTLLAGRELSCLYKPETKTFYTFRLWETDIEQFVEEIDSFFSKGPGRDVNII